MAYFSYYKIVLDRQPTGLLDIVNNMIKDGWIPCGGLCVDKNDVYYQAMWRPPLPEEIKIHMQNAFASKDIT
jgi:hypothetical protein